MNAFQEIGRSVAASGLPIETLELLLLLLLLLLRFGHDLVFGAVRERVVWFGRAARMISTPLYLLALAIVVARLLS